MTTEDNGKPQKRERFTSDTVNLIIAGCAVLISAASFIATYVQSEAALRQVKAETWPILQLDHGNVNDEGDSEIYMDLHNVGVGPAKIKSFQLMLRNRVISGAQILPKLAYDENVTQDETGSFLTDVISPKTLPDGSKKTVFSVRKSNKNLAVWSALNEVRWALKASACYCSLFDECFETDFVNEPIEVQMCMADEHSFNSYRTVTQPAAK